MSTEALEWPITAYNSKGTRTVCETFRVEVADLGFVAVVPKGFDIFDGASIPRALWSSIGHPFTKGYERAALVHDYLYKTPSARDRPPYAGFAKDREQIDELFYKMLLQDGVKRMRAKTMHWAVRKYGDRHGRYRVAESSPVVILTPDQQDEISKLLQGDARGLLQASRMPSFAVGDAPPELTDSELLDGLSEIFESDE